MAEQELELQELNGTVTAVLYSNAENGYTVLKLQDSEVAEVKWASHNEVCQMMQDGTFVPYFPGLIDLLWQVRDNYDGAIRQQSSDAKQKNF